MLYVGVYRSIKQYEVLMWEGGVTSLRLYNGQNGGIIIFNGQQWGYLTFYYPFLKKCHEITYQSLYVMCGACMPQFV